MGRSKDASLPCTFNTPPLNLHHPSQSRSAHQHRLTCGEIGIGSEPPRSDSLQLCPSRRLPRPRDNNRRGGGAPRLAGDRGRRRVEDLKRGMKGSRAARWSAFKGSGPEEGELLRVHVGGGSRRHCNAALEQQRRLGGRRM